MYLKFIKLLVSLSFLVCCGFVGRVLYSRVIQGKDPRHTVFLRLLVCDDIKFRDDHGRMRINDPLASFARASGRRIVGSSWPSYI